MFWYYFSINIPSEFSKDFIIIKINHKNSYKGFSWTSVSLKKSRNWRCNRKLYIYIKSILICSKPTQSHWINISFFLKNFLFSNWKTEPKNTQNCSDPVNQCLFGDNASHSANQSNRASCPEGRPLPTTGLW